MGVTRRDLLRAGGAGLAAGVAVPAGWSAAGAAVPDLPPVPALAPSTLARDTGFWEAVAGQYDATRAVVHLENGNWGMMARPVLEDYRRHQDRVNRETSYYTRREFGRDAREVVRRVAALLGAGEDEIALTRGATEALLTLIAGYHRLGPGDAVLYADLDYDSMQAGLESLRRRRGVEVVRIDLPEPATHQGLIDTYERALAANPRVRLMLLTHLSHRTGLVLPVAEIVSMARARGVDVIVDAAHSLGQVPFDAAGLGADFVGYNLHKWIGAPLGVGVMYIRRDRLDAIEPHMGEPEGAQGIRARIHTGTTDFATLLAVPAAIDFHQRIGTPAIAARLRHLRDLWAETLRGSRGIEILTPKDPRLAAGITSFRLAGKLSAEENAAVARQLLERSGIFTVHRTGVAKGACVRVTPALFTREEDIRKLTAALRLLAGG
ncbi:aminotransferase class V-fold PLP-dependent enzyme [Rhodocista pekingensis]|uniref:Aminotransferase class V-fold PLP-dependent enzyme n=1 Tax=Rhodocista pekingensis TaxID=201185 RepID=A0ABW2L1J4_9PROT